MLGPWATLSRTLVARPGFFSFFSLSSAALVERSGGGTSAARWLTWLSEESTSLDLPCDAAERRGRFEGGALTQEASRDTLTPDNGRTTRGTSNSWKKRCTHQSHVRGLQSGSRV